MKKYFLCPSITYFTVHFSFPDVEWNKGREGKIGGEKEEKEKRKKPKRERQKERKKERG